MFVPGLKRMKDRVAIGDHHPNARVLRIRAARLCERDVARFRIVEVVQTGIHKRAFTAHPSNLEGVIGPDLTRNLEVPVLDVGVAALPVLRQSDYIENGVGWVKLARDGILDRSDRVQRWMDDSEAAARRRVELQDVHIVKLCRGVEDSIPTANDGGLVETPGKPKSRADVVVFVLPEVVGVLTRLRVEHGTLR